MSSIRTFGGKSATGRRGEIIETPTNSQQPVEAMAAAQKPAKRLGGMAEALAIAGDLGFPAPPAQEDQNTSDKSDDLVRVLRELTVVQRNIANLQVELQGRKDDKNIAHLTHVSEMEKKCESLARITAILKDVIQNK
uniref:Uncharacterized protein n=1 Tax=Aegilops tauschii subsp. strangulata TaxID=200361 RepID=A0A453SXC4_AEGTS